MTTVNKIPLSIVSGFLGAGKTTFIKKLVKEVYAMDKIVVLENEFGKIDLDGENLSRERIPVESIRGGCICCTSSDMLALHIKGIVEKHHPDRIIIEPTGLARLTDVLAALSETYVEEHCSMDSIITIVDAGNFCRRMDISKVFFENQISASHTIFLSKTENLPERQLKEVSESIYAVNRKCGIIMDAWDTMPLSRLKEALAFSDDTRSGVKNADMPGGNPPHGAGIFDSFSYESSHFITTGTMEGLFAGFLRGEYGDIVRAKGVFLTAEQIWYTCEYVPGEIRISPVQQDMSSCRQKLLLCVIGRDLQNEGIRGTLGINRIRDRYSVSRNCLGVVPVSFLKTLEK